MPWYLSYALTSGGVDLLRTHRQWFLQQETTLRVEVVEANGLLSVWFRSCLSPTDPESQRIYLVHGVRRENSMSQVFQQQYLGTWTDGIRDREALARRMVEPLRRRIDYASIGRQLLPIQQLPDGARQMYRDDIPIPTTEKAPEPLQLTVWERLLADD